MTPAWREAVRRNQVRGAARLVQLYCDSGVLRLISRSRVGCVLRLWVFALVLAVEGRSERGAYAMSVPAIA
eukprot:3412077-Rhodomonas_salina.1